ncbi:MAG TPA: antitoxin Xre/MbcA/ParS toxin-binding domain-containing protein [Edaphobacter sp.]
MVEELEMIVSGLGGEKAVGRSVHSFEDLSEAIREGFRQEAMRHLAKASGQSLKQVSEYLNISYRSVMRRPKTKQLPTTESDRLYRLARIVALANHYIGDQKRALAWLHQPNLVLGGKAPLHLIDTELGARQVEKVLGRIAYGGVS